MPDAKGLELSPLSSLAAWSGLDPGARATFGRALSEHLGQAYTLLAPAGTLGLVQVRHDETGIAFVAVPGGSFVMGMTPDDLATLSGVSWDEDFAPAWLSDLAAAASPPRTVAVAPFLCARTPAPESIVGIACDVPARFVAEAAGETARQAASRWGFRLLSECEYEYLARGGGRDAFLYAPDPMTAERVLSTMVAVRSHGGPPNPNRPLTTFGVWGLHAPTWLADDEHSNYEGAPLTSGPWGTPATPRVLRGGAEVGYPWPVNLGLIECLAAFRRGAIAEASAEVRFVRELGGVPTST